MGVLCILHKTILHMVILELIIGWLFMALMQMTKDIFGMMINCEVLMYYQVFLA